MTFEQRMAELGVDLSDLPKPSYFTFAYDVNSPTINEQIDHIVREYTGPGLNDDDYQSDIRMYYDYILHLTDVIDRMETRLVNVTEELNYIKDAFRDCATCTAGSVPHSDRCDSCDENFINYEFAGVPEDWRPDNDSTVN